MSFAFWLTLLIMLLGALGTFLPVLPGTPIIFAAALGYAIYEGFKEITVLVLVVLFLLMSVTFFVDYFAGAVGAKKYGAGKYGTWGSFIGGVLGFILLNIPGLIIGPFVGAVAGEMLSGKDLNSAFRVGLGTMIGLAGGAILKFMLAASMIALYVKSVI
ncbi:MAG TPA: DUF456 domain-containing protein [Desulfobacteria bacterium]|nr:DUF456 domain-containing protein [Desulfobacteria bacterium]